MFSAGPLVVDEADPRQVCSVALTTSEGLVRIWVGWCGGGPARSPLSFHFQSFTPGGFKVFIGLVDSLAPAVALCSLSGPLIEVYVAGLERLLQAVLEPFL